MAMWLLWILSLAASFLLPATGEVVPNFQRCSGVFLDGNPPNLEPKRWARICQKYKSNTYHFATMYDRTRRIPLFSAYKYQTGEGVRPDDWMIEPQLALPSDQKRASMELEETCGIDRNELKKSQAVEGDYKVGARYDKGHLLPYSHRPDQISKDATFTLTNIVPQLRLLNNGQWRIYEENINAAGCQDTYIIVGAVPGNNRLNNRVNIPSHIWAAGCCVVGNNGRRSWAVIAENDKDKVDHLTLGELQTQLAALYNNKIKKNNNNNNNIDLFNSAC